MPSVVELTARFRRVLIVLLAVHIAAIFLTSTSIDALPINLFLIGFVLIGMLAAARQHTCVLVMWGVLMGLYVAFQTVLIGANLIHFVRYTINVFHDSTAPAWIILGSVVASLFIIIYYSVCLSAAILAFRLRCSIACANSASCGYSAVEMGQVAAEPAAVADEPQFYSVPTVGAPVPYAVPAEFANASGQPMYVMVPIVPVAQQ